MHTFLSAAGFFTMRYFSNLAIVFLTFFVIAICTYLSLLNFSNADTTDLNADSVLVLNSLIKFIYAYACVWYRGMIRWYSNG